MKCRIGLLVTLISLLLPAVCGAECVGLSKQLGQAEKSVLANIWGSIQLLVSSEEPVKEDCGSLATVIDHLTNRKRTGGRRLEEEKPLDVQAARADLDKAMQDEEIRARLDKARATFPDETAAMIYQAAILDAAGHYAARDLIVSQLVERNK